MQSAVDTAPGADAGDGTISAPSDYLLGGGAGWAAACCLAATLAR
ncbi:hypothetical protein FHS31_003027 [Sphingomonas vulcanisoli]|uniref:Uncharacterized protein n=1 Tax=Sphingomonas vulcanisoli TaxID=1658060 RepID=A0ABX0TYA0_9SPHN|nr:hypothetical protein [Sphingomonas vulcanisoli]NIJ09395.1 hypothetical protein [Sphingomonas vulcanisoli]